MIGQPPVPIEISSRQIDDEPPAAKEDYAPGVPSRHRINQIRAQRYVSATEKKHSPLAPQVAPQYLNQAGADNYHSYKYLPAMNDRERGYAQKPERPGYPVGLSPVIDHQKYQKQYAVGSADIEPTVDIT